MALTLIAASAVPFMLPAVAGDTPPLRVAVMDPLAAPLSCPCVKGIGQRRYDALATSLEKTLDRPVKMVFEESLDLALPRLGGKVDVVIGQASTVEFDAKRMRVPLEPMLRLTDRAGRTHTTGAFVVRKGDRAKALADLEGRLVLLPSDDHADMRVAAVASLTRAGGIDRNQKPREAASLDTGAIAVFDREADAAVISDFMLPFLEACGKVTRGSLRVIGHTDPVPFITVYRQAGMPDEERKSLRRALLAITTDAPLLDALESKQGFVELEPDPPAAAEPRAEPTAEADWPDWRGPGRRGESHAVPDRLPEAPRRLWTAAVTGPAMAGIAVSGRFVVVPDKDKELTTDIIRCFDAHTGESIWQFEYAAAAPLDYTSAPRATPVIHEGLVYVQGALGQLHCLDLATGKVVWKTHLLTDFDAAPLTWGACTPPLVVDDMLIMNPGGRLASLVALDRRTGRVVWKTPGDAAAYSAFILATIHGIRQIIGYDVAGLGGWRPETGERLWTLVPPDGADFNVPTPVIIDGNRLLVATENNAARLYAFAEDGRLRTEPLARNLDLAPDTPTPVIVGHRGFCTAYGQLFCIDLANNLETLWLVDDDMFFEHTNLIAGEDRVLIWTMGGDLLLIDALADDYRVVSHVRPFEGKKHEIMSAPAIVGSCLYVRSATELVCLDLTRPDDAKTAPSQ